MFRRRQQTPWEKEWDKLMAQEERFLSAKPPRAAAMLNEKLEKYVPDKLQATLDLAFYKAFQLIFTKGTGVIEKTYDKDKRSVDYQIHSYAADLKGSRKSLSVFRKKAGMVQTVNLAASAVEGVGLGALGIGLPDIPLFTGMILKSVYEIAINYGFSYDTEPEQAFLLKVIETAVLDENRRRKEDAELNLWCREPLVFSGSIDAQIRRTAAALSEELLYMKFLQGIPIVGAVGGWSDVQCLKTITTYANLKYQRRFLQKKRTEKEMHKEKSRENNQ